MNPLHTFILAFTTTIIFISLLKRSNKCLTKMTTSLPPGPKNLPIIGSIHHLYGSRLPHRVLRDLSAIYGPIMRFKLGEINAVIISSADAAREIMQTHDVIFASRPLITSISTIFYGGIDIGFSPYGKYWRQMRQICNKELLSMKRVKALRAIRVEEVIHLLRSIEASHASIAINLSEGFFKLANNITTISLIGRMCAGHKDFISVMKEFLELVTGLSIFDIFPSMPSFIMRITGFKKKLEQCSLKLDQLGESIIQEHIQKRDQNFIEEDNDITDVLLRIQQDKTLQIPLSNEHIKAVIIDLLIGGSDTSAVTLEWAITELIRNPNVMKKAQKEVREVLGTCGNEMIIKDDELLKGRLNYLQSVIKETMRLHPPAPLLVPRQSQERCEVLGYDILARTTVMVNAWAIGRDPKYWAKPEMFCPERFEDSQVNMKGTHFELIPFGAGRRICPGMNFGLAIIEMALAHLLYYFDWEYKNENGEELDINESFGITTSRKSPLCLFAIPFFPLPNTKDVK